MNGMTDNPLRWKIAMLLCLASALSYVDRNALAILAPTIQKELDWSDADYGNITALFVLSYTVMYAISGRIIDRIGTRLGLAWSVGAWSCVTILHAIATSIGQFSVARVLLGITESGNFPAGVKAISEWFPMKERALAIGIFAAGSSIGAACAVPLVSYVALLWGWRMAFVVTGGLGLVWLVAWLRLCHAPEGAKPPALDGDPSRTEAPGAPARSASVWSLLKRSDSWGCFSARILIDPVVYFFIFWIPKYLHDIHGFTLSEIGMTAWMPYAAMGFGTILGGWLPKILIERNGWSLDRSRKSIMLIASVSILVFCALLSAGIGPAPSIILISAIMLAHGLWSNITLPTEIFPSGVQATITGIGGTLGGMMSFVTQKMIGASVGDHSYLPIFLSVGIAYLTAFLLVHALIGRLGAIREI